MKQTLREIFYSHQDRLVHKWDHYFEIYEKHFEKYRGTEVNLLEIGVSQGGSIQLWKKYFGEKLNIYSVDVNSECLAFEADTTRMYIGSQEDPVFLQKLKNELPPMDIIIDDGGHKMKQQLLTFEYLFLKVKEGGVYLVEDTHTSYWPTFGGGIRKRSSFIEFSKKLIDSLHHAHLRNPRSIINSEIAKHILSISFYDSIVVFHKGLRPAPFHIKRGTASITDFKHMFTFWEKVRARLFGVGDVTLDKTQGKPEHSD